MIATNLDFLENDYAHNITGHPQYSSWTRSVHCIQIPSRLVLTDISVLSGLGYLSQGGNNFGIDQNCFQAGTFLYVYEMLFLCEEPLAVTMMSDIKYSISALDYINFLPTIMSWFC